MKTECRECGKSFNSLPQDGQLFCSVHCQLIRDPLECDAVHTPMRTRGAKTPPRIPKTHIPPC